jgi:ubiquinone/menaquinone biosynthesis C-methylase UbiE
MSIEFDAETLKRLEALYVTRDARQRRQAVLKGLELKPGERVLDIGTGAGFLAVEMADAVGASGEVLGIDRSPTMLAAARVRCEGRPWVQFREADATLLPVPDAAADVAASVQVLEYVQDARAALAEIRRALRPGGRAAVVATDWDGIAWVSSDEQRMRKVLRAFDSHCAFTSLPRMLAPMLREAGFGIDGVSLIPQLNLSCDADSYSFHMIRIIQDFVRERNASMAEELSDWASDLHALDQNGRYFFCVNQYLFLVTRI